MQTITPCLWFEGNAEEAVRFYTSVFKDGKIGKTSHYGEAGFEIHRMKADTILTIEFEINGQTFTALNGGPEFKFNEAISFQVLCDSQEEIDYYWEKLSQGGDKQAQQCGWLKDRYGVSWQIVPAVLGDLLADPSCSERVMTALLKMKKLDVAVLMSAANRPL